MNKWNFKILLSKSILPVILNIYIKTISIKYINDIENYRNKIFVFWHSKMFIGWWLFRNKKFSALVSKSMDGEILANILKKWNFSLVRGSSSKGGKEAIEELVTGSKEASSFVITPDGPRGPVKEFKNGALILSFNKKLEIIPVNINYTKKIVLNRSWDKFEIPFPFTMCTVQFGKPYIYDKYLYNADLENFKSEICQEL